LFLPNGGLVRGGGGRGRGSERKQGERGQHWGGQAKKKDGKRGEKKEAKADRIERVTAAKDPSCTLKKRKPPDWIGGGGMKWLRGVFAK